jgi:microcystin-dependent protein
LGETRTPSHFQELFAMTIQKISRALGIGCLAVSLSMAATLPYQGLATQPNGLPAVDGSHPATFKLYSVSTGGTEVWSELQSVTTKKGLFAVTLGSVVSIPENLFTGSPLYLGVTLDNGTEAMPRLALGAVPYAIGAGRSDSSRASSLADSAKSVAGLAALTTTVTGHATTLGAHATSITSLSNSVTALTTKVRSDSTVLGGKIKADSLALIAKIKADSLVLASAGGGSKPTVADQTKFQTWDGTNWVAKTLTLSNAGESLPFDIMPPYTVVNFQIAMQGIFPSRDAMDPYLGEIMMTGFNFATRGYMRCDGQLVSLRENTALFALLGTQYGGNGTTTFALPDMRGRMPMHQGDGPGLTPRVMGEMSGSENKTLTTSQMPVHTHTPTLTTVP